MILLAGLAGLALGWWGAVAAGRVLDERDEGLPPMPAWVRPVNAAVTGALCFVVPWIVDDAWLVLPYVLFVALTMMLVVTDIHSQLIPNRVNYPGTTIAAATLLVAAVIIGDLDAVFRSIGGALIYYGITMVLLIVGRGSSFGGGDVKLSVVLGIFTAFLGWDVFAAAVVLGFLIGGVAGALLLLIRSKGLRDHFAFGPPMVFGAYIALVWGESLVDWYLR